MNISSSFYSFTNKAIQADIVGFDETGDGNWEHMAFVTDVDDTSGTDYRDIRIAQHSKDYVAWVSSNSNGWENLKSEYPNIKFGIIYWRYLP